MTLNGISYRATENLAIGDIVIATADHGRNPFHTEAEVCAWPLDFDTICFFHQPLERLHTGLKLAVIQAAHSKVKIFKSLSAHPGKLCHRRSRPT